MPAPQRVAIAAAGFLDDPRAGAPRNLSRAVIGTIVDHHNFARDPQALQSFHRLGDTGADGFGFIQAWQDDG